MSDFPKCGKDKYRANCKKCHNLKNRKWKERVGYYETYGERYKEYHKHYDKYYRLEVLGQKPKTKLSDGERKRRKNKNRSNWAKRNLAKEAFWSSMKRKRVRLATPKWLTDNQREEIEKFYILAKEKQSETGVKYHVDHICPLKGVNGKGEHVLCGLHVPWNLQVIVFRDNLTKSNKVLDTYI